LSVVYNYVFVYYVMGNSQPKTVQTLRADQMERAIPAADRLDEELAFLKKQLADTKNSNDRIKYEADIKQILELIRLRKT
jgi:uncharacterized protein (UPF0335 family)